MNKMRTKNIKENPVTNTKLNINISFGDNYFVNVFFAIRNKYNSNRNLIRIFDFR